MNFTIKEDDGEQYNVPTVAAKEGYVFTGWEVQGEETGHWDADAKTFGIAGLAHFPEGSDEGYVTVTAQFEKAEPEEKEARDVKVTFNVDPEKGEFTDPAGAEYVNFTIKEDDGEQYNVPTVAAKEGYVFTGWEVQGEETGHWDADAKTFGIAGLAHFPEGSNEGYVTVTAQFEKAEPEEKEARDVIVNFNVDPEKGDFTDPAGAKVVTFTIKEDDGNQYLVPTVEAKEGYVFTGWEVQGEETGHWDADAKTFGVTGLAHFPEGSNEGYVTVTAQFEEVKPEVAVANANVVVDPDKGSFDGYDGATTLNNEHLEEADYTLGYLPTVTANDGYKWTGWVVTNKAGETILDLDTNASSIAFDYGVADTYTVTAKFEEVKPEVAVANANVVVDPVKGSFDGYDGATTLNNEHLEEADYTLGYLPTVTANDGYKWTGWVVTNKAGETILDLDTNASSIAFDYGVADTYTVTAKFETVTPEQPGTPE